MVLALAASAYAEPPRDELAHAYRLIKDADADYAGHRVAALEEVRLADKELGISLEGEAPEREAQWKSDARLTEARRLLKDAREKLGDRDRDRVAGHVDKAIHELDAALRVH